ncbi:MAG: hypothetical protein L0J14_07110, partial [Bifidobacterium crudilactis]|nr:hypothetical protein [Bifidobacterium crudilactis]
MHEESYQEQQTLRVNRGIMSHSAYRTHYATEVSEAEIGNTVTVSGWVDRRRDHGGVAFIDLRDM